MTEENKTRVDLSEDRDLLLWREDFYLPIFEHALTEIGDLHGVRILEIGCGTGGTAVLLAKRGASVLGIDLLSFRLDDAKKRTAEHGVAESVQFALMDAMQLAFDDNTFDLVISKSALIFTDHIRAARECYRVLKPEGQAIFIENMHNHPPLWLYRKLFVNYASNTHYFSMVDIEKIGENFDFMQHREFHLLAIGALIWQKLCPVSTLYQFTLKHLKSLDDCLLKWFPPLRRFCWITAMICDKR
ncbi:MAG: class I SAM-dependent methyltransferase [Candidatus Poribacteria bacterium]